MPVYLLHFDQPYKHASHYLGYASNVKRRLEKHAKGLGARLLQVLIENGIGWQLVRTWSKGDRILERRLKRQKKSSRLCPICRAKLKDQQGKPAGLRIAS